MDELTAIIVVKNNPPLIFKTISSVEDLAKEIIIVDIGIDINLNKKLLKNKKIRIIKIRKEILYVETIREESKKYAKTKYVFFLDPDEELPNKLKQTIKEKLFQYDYLKIPRKNIIFGKWIQYSRWWPDYQIRVFNKEKVIWPKKIHQQPEVNGQGFEITPKEEFALIHYNYQNLDEYLEKARRYAKIEAKQMIEEKISFDFNQTIKKSLNEFISRYFAFQGYKDGLHGFILSFLQMFYYFLVYFYYLESNQYKTNEKIQPDYFFRQALKETLHWKKNKSLKEKIIKNLL